MVDTPNGETATPGDTQTEVKTTTTPSQDNGSAAEVERLRKQAEQAEIRNRQLENEKKARDEADEAARQKQLEEDNQHKTLYEQEKAKREALEKEREDAVKKIELEDSQKKLLAEFPPEVTEAASDIDLTLSDTSDEAIEAYKSKLTKLSARVSQTGKVRSNNQNTNSNQPTREELLQDYAKTNSSATYDTMLSGLNFVKQSKAINGDE